MITRDTSTMSTEVEIYLYCDSTKANRFYDVPIPFYAKQIHTLVTNHPDAVTWWIYEAKLLKTDTPHGRIIGLDVKVVPSGPAEGRVATLHLCVDSTCLVYQIHRASDVPSSLNSFFAVTENIFVGVDVGAKLELLQRDYGVGGCARYEDLGALAVGKYGRPELRRTELLELEIIVTGEAVTKTMNVDQKWHYGKLSKEKVWTAAVDGFRCMHFGRMLMNPLMPKKWNYGDRDAIEQFSYVRIFKGKFKKYIHTTVTKHGVAVAKWVDDVMNDRSYHRYVGFDMELFFIDKQQRVATVQFCVNNRCLIIRFYMMTGRKIPSLERFLLHCNHTFVGVGIVQKMGLLLEMLGYEDGGRLRGIDLGKFAATRYGWPMLNYAGTLTLARLLLKSRLKMPALESDWYRRNRLSYGQVVWACVDAVVPFEIATRLCPVHY